MREFKIAKFLSNTFICSALHTSLISTVLIPYFKFNNMLPFQISILVTIKRLVRLGGDMFFGFIFDRFGAKIVFLTGRLMKLLSYFILLIKPSFISLCCAMIIYGLSEGTIQGKVSSFIYNNLRANDRLSFFTKAMSYYYLVIDIHIAFISFLTGILLQKYSYNLIIYISMCMNIFSLFLIIKLIPSNSQNNLNQFVSKSIKDILKTLKFVIQKNHLFIYLIALYGILVFFSWQFGSIASMVLLDMGLQGTGIAMIGSAVKICMAVGTVIPILLVKNTLSLKTISIIIFSFVSIGLISAINYNLYLFCIFMLIFDLFYVTLEVSLEKNLETISDKTIRGTAISLAMTFCNLVAVITNLLVGFIAQLSNYKVALLSVLITMFVFCFVLLVIFCQKNIKKK